MGILRDRPSQHVPVWFMRQAGRYHDHYQARRSKHGFMELCKRPELACEVTLGPIEDFGFDAAILFSDLLFPLEQLGLGLSYEQGPPKMDLKIRTSADVTSLKPISGDFYQFQESAMQKLSSSLPEHVERIGFVGSPFTLYAYAVEGGHAGQLNETKKGLVNGLFTQFNELLIPSILESMRSQMRGGAEVMSVFDTAAGELSHHDFKHFVVPALNKLLKTFKAEFPDTPVIYYSKFTHTHYLRELDPELIQVLGVDWRHHLPSVYDQFSQSFMIQGNIDPSWLHLPWNDLKNHIERVFREMGGRRQRWIFGLGHGVTVGTPQENVKNAVKLIQTL